MENDKKILKNIEDAFLVDNSTNNGISYTSVDVGMLKSKIPSEFVLYVLSYQKYIQVKC